MAGRPKRTYTDEEIANIEQYARDNCYNKTISTALNIPIHTLERNFGTKIRRWRAQGKVELRANQRNLSKTSADMCKFLGKNVLNQTDKQVIETKAPPVKELTEPERQAVADAARAYKLRLTSQEAV